MSDQLYMVKVRDAALSLLKRPLTKEEETEFLEFGTAVGVNNAQDFMHMMLIYHRAAQKIQVATENMEERNKVQTAKIDAELTRIVEEHEKLRDEIKMQFLGTIENATKQAMETNIESMKRAMDEHAMEVVGKHRDLYAIRVAVVFIVILGVTSAISYMFGAFGFRYYHAAETSGGSGAIRQVIGAVTGMKTGWWMLFAALTCGFTWIYEHWLDILHVKSYRIKGFFILSVALLILAATLYF